jgi:subfamily B ATP-binding cassette protein MsbA
MLRRRDLSTPLSEFLGITIVVVVLYLGGRLVLNHTSDLSPETFITFIVIFSQIIQPAKAFSNAYYFIQKGLASLNRVEELLNEKVLIQDDKAANELKSFQQSIELKNISFSYPGRPVLYDINLNISKGKKIALVGVSGSGKSTLIQLIMRFFDSSVGEILIDGKNIRNISQDSLRKQIALVTQHAVLFNDTVANNISLGNDVDEIKIMQAAQQAFAWDFIKGMPGELQAYIGDNGSKLSGGEQQRLALARAFYKNAPILILDEATAHLDSNNEQLVQKALYELWKDKTAIIIAHRLSTVQNCDEIIVLKNGRIVEQGSPSALIAQNGEYKRLVELQQL